MTGYMADGADSDSPGCAALDGPGCAALDGPNCSSLAAANTEVDGTNCAAPDEWILGPMDVDNGNGATSSGFLPSDP